MSVNAQYWIDFIKYTLSKMLEETPELAYNGGEKGCLGSYRNSFCPSKLICLHLFTPMPLGIV